MGDEAADARTAARRELWQRFDAGAIGADELVARLRRVDRAAAGSDADRATTVRLRVRERKASGLAVTIVGLAVVLGIGIAGAAALAGGDDVAAGGSAGGGGGGGVVGGVVASTIVVAPGGPGVVLPPVAESCDELDEFLAARDAAGGTPTEQFPNASLLSDPAYVPDGYSVVDTYDVVPGSDPNIAMSVAAGSPLPVEILARDLDGPLLATLRSFRYASADDAVASDEQGPSQALCTYGGELVDVPEGSGIFAVNLPAAPIPPTTFASFQSGDRRVSVAVTAASPDDDDMAAAAAVAVDIAVHELDAARASSSGG